MIAIFIFLVLTTYFALCLCATAKRGDEQPAGALGIDLAEPAYRAPQNRRGHRLGKWLAFHKSVWRVQ